MAPTQGSYDHAQSTSADRSRGSLGRRRCWMLLWWNQVAAATRCGGRGDGPAGCRRRRGNGWHEWGVGRDRWSRRGRTERGRHRGLWRRVLQHRCHLWFAHEPGQRIGEHSIHDPWFDGHLLVLDWLQAGRRCDEDVPIRRNLDRRSTNMRSGRLRTALAPGQRLPGRTIDDLWGNGNVFMHDRLRSIGGLDTGLPG
jgi:hypothetical protein